MTVGTMSRDRVTHLSEERWRKSLQLGLGAHNSDDGLLSVAIMRKIESADPVKYDEIIDRVWPQGELKLTPEKWAAAKRDSEL